MFLKLLVLGSLCYTCFGCLVVDDVDPEPTVQFSDGKVLGSIKTSINGRKFFQFLGIPYGVVQNRHAISEPARPWEGIRDGRKDGPNCIRESLSEVVVGVLGVQDCLVLNVFTSHISNPSHELPVLVFIHGDDLVLEAASGITSSNIMDQNAVFVTVNLRLGPSGFLNTEVNGVSGNQGVKDGILALKWVQENIQNFGGDPSTILLLGQNYKGLTLIPVPKGPNTFDF